LRLHLNTQGLRHQSQSPQPLQRSPCGVESEDGFAGRSCLAHLLRTDRHRSKPLVLLLEACRLLDRLCLDLRKLVDDRTRVVNQINDCLKEFYPQALELFYKIDSAISIKIDSAISIAFLETFSGPDTLLTATRRCFRAF
jgi:hypothetical protein